MRLFAVMRLIVGRGSDLHFPRGRANFVVEYAKWEYRARFGPRLKFAGTEKATIVFLSYKRPQNIEPLVRSALKCSFVAKVIVCNNNPDVRLESWVGVSDSRLVLLNQNKNLGPGYRFDIAIREPGDYFCFIDDDVFLYPEQIRQLFSSLLEDPSVPHGVRGQVVFDNQDFVDGIYGKECKVDILNGVYAFTKAHLEEYFRLDKELNGLPRVDDIVLSFSGESAPSCHDVGEILLCPTEALPGIALWKEPDFLTHRLAALERLSQVKHLAQSALSLPSLSGLAVLASQSLFSIDTIGEDINQQKEPVVISQYQRGLVVRGWAVDARARDLAGGVYLDIDGTLYPAFYGGIRKDVAEHFQIERYNHSGFQRLVFNLKPGIHRISLVILSHDRKAYYKPEHSVMFEICPIGLTQKFSHLVRHKESATIDDHLVRIKLIRNFFPHWATHSGAHQFANHANGRNFQFDQTVVPLGNERFPLVPGKFQEWLRRSIKKNGIQWYDLNNLRAESEAFFDCFRKRPDLIHCLDGEYMQYLPKFLKKVGRIRSLPPLIASFHQPPEILRKVLNNEIVGLLDHVIVYCSAQASYFERFLGSAKISLVPHGIDTVFFQPQRRRPDGILKCLTVGFWLRDFETIWRVVRKMQAYPDIEFHLVTPKQEPPEKFSRVKVYENLNDEELLNLYQQSDVLFMPLLDSAANNAILEAAAAGLPIVSSSVGGVAEYTDQSFAILVAAGDVDGFTDAILKLRRVPEVRHQMGLAARHFAEENLSWSRVTEQMFDVYRRVLSSVSNRN
jgi:glycosyltransferase involved in cell wall biosynthesis